MQRHKWTPLEDAALVQCMVEMHQLGHRNADSGFKGSFLPELEKMLGEKLPGCVLKAKPHIESRLKTLKKDWMIVYDMVHGKNTSGFGWDDTRKMVTAEDEVWNAYIQSHKDAAPFRARTFVHFDELTRIYAKDRATGHDSQSVQEVLAEAENENTPDPTSTPTQLSPDPDFHFAETVNQQSSSANNVAGKKRKKRNDDAFEKVVLDLGNSLSRYMTAPTTVIDGIQEKLPLLDAELRSVDGLTDEEIENAHIMFSNKRDLVLVFFGVAPTNRLKWVMAMLNRFL